MEGKENWKSILEDVNIYLHHWQRHMQSRTYRGALFILFSFLIHTSVRCSQKRVLSYNVMKDSSFNQQKKSDISSLMLRFSRKKFSDKVLIFIGITNGTD